MEVVELTLQEIKQEMNLSNLDISRILGIPKKTLDNWQYSNQQCPPWCEALIVEKLLCFHNIRGIHKKIVVEDVGIPEILEKTQLSLSYISKETGIPFSTLYNWKVGRRLCPIWCEKLVVEKITTLYYLKDNRSSK